MSKNHTKVTQFGVRRLYDPQTLKEIHNFDDLAKRKPKTLDTVVNKKRFSVQHNSQIDFYRKNGALQAMQVQMQRDGLGKYASKPE